MISCHRCKCSDSLIFLRSVHISSVLECGYYKALGLNPSATHAEIKTAYYELSKKHHPDRNQGSERSAKMFRSITAAYEVLGNEKLRRQYDIEQQINRRTETSYCRTDYSDDIERIFYQRTRRKPVRYYGRDKYFNYDVWYKAHYGAHSNWDKYYKFDNDTVKPRKCFYKDPNNIASSNRRRSKSLIYFTVVCLGIIYCFVWHKQNFISKKNS